MAFNRSKVTEMLYYMLQPGTDDEENQEVEEGDLPPKVHKIMRNSLSMEQNEVG